MFRDAVAAELLKIRTVRSTPWTLLVAFLLCVGLTLLFCLTLRAEYTHLDPAQKADWDPVAVGFYSLTIGQIALVVLGVLLVGAEHSTGMIRASLAAVPSRTAFYAAKVTAATVTVAVFSLVTAAATLLAGQAALGPHGSWTGAPRATLFAALYLTLICAFAMGVAALLRGTALSLGLMIPLLFLDSQGLGNLPAIRSAAQFLPDQAGQVMVQTHPPAAGSIAHHAYGPWTALLIVAAWTLAALAGGHRALSRRDA